MLGKEPTPRLSRTLPSNAEMRDMGFRLQRLVEALQHARMQKFTVMCYRTLLTACREEPTVEQRLARAVELSVGRRAQASADAAAEGMLTTAPEGVLTTAPVGMFEPRRPMFDYSAGLHSQVPRQKSMVVFLKVEALWPGGHAHFHLRVRVLPLAHQTNGVPGLVLEASMDAHALVLEALVRMPPHAPLEPLVATMALSQQEVHASAVRRARMQAAGRYLVD